MERFLWIRYCEDWKYEVGVWFYGKIGIWWLFNNYYLLIYSFRYYDIDIMKGLSKIWKCYLKCD